MEAMGAATGAEMAVVTAGAMAAVATEVAATGGVETEAAGTGAVREVVVTAEEKAAVERVEATAAAVRGRNVMPLRKCRTKPRRDSAAAAVSW